MIERRKGAMIAALWSNSNYDDDKGSRQSAIDDLEQKSEAAINIVLTGVDPNEGEDIDEENPFFASMRKGQAKLAAKLEGTTVGESIEYEGDFDQG